MDPDPNDRLALTHSLFPNTRTMLASPEVRMALYSVAPVRIRKTYRDAVDFLFCELLTGYRDLCQRFYLGESPPLHALSIATPERTAHWDIMLMAVLMLADEVRTRRRDLTWDRLRDLIIEADASR